MKKEVSVLITSLSLVSCDYYYAAMEYKDNDRLGKIYSWDKNINNDNQTPIALEYDSFCFLKKKNTWILLNGKSKNTIVSLYGDNIPCITYSEKEWVEKVCPSLTKRNIQKINSFSCN